jgi:3-methyl-2-oxobutanoate hydroxymethyltransferase
VHAGIEMMRWHTEAVARGAGDKFVIADMPFLSFRKGVTAALDTAQALMAAGAQAVKLEGVEGHEDVIERLTQSGIPVMGHLGLQPQSVHAYGGYRVQGRTERAAQEIAGQAKTLEQLGAFSVVLECVPARLAREVTAAVGIPTIGIGAGADCDGQILVLQDMLGLNADFQPRFARKFLNGACLVKQAVEGYRQAVRTGAFPAAGESFD